MKTTLNDRISLSQLCSHTHLSSPKSSHRPLVAGTSEADQLDRIFRLLGTPTLTDFPGIVELPEYTPDMPPYPAPRGGLGALVPTLDSNGVDLLQKMLRYAPEKRVTAEQALEHPFFHDMIGRNA